MDGVTAILATLLLFSAWSNVVLLRRNRHQRRVVEALKAYVEQSFTRARARDKEQRHLLRTIRADLAQLEVAMRHLLQGPGYLLRSARMQQWHQLVQSLRSLTQARLGMSGAGLDVTDPGDITADDTAGEDNQAA